MSTWKKYKLRELCSEIIDCVNKTAPISDTPTQYKMLRTSDVRGGFINLENLNCVSEETFEKWSRRGKLQKGDVILTREAPLGEVGLVRQADNYFLGQRLVLYRANPNLCDGRFMMYALLYDENKQAIVGKGNGATVHHLRIPDCETIEIKAPDLPTQKRIADILSAYDDLIENNQRQIKLLEEAAMRLYREWFVFMRFPGHESVRIVDGVPEGWERVTVADCLSMSINGGWGKENPERSYQIPGKVIRGTDINDVKSGIVFSIPSRFHTEKDVISRRLSKWDIVFELSNGNIDNIGRTLLVDSYVLDVGGENLICASFCKLLRPLSPEIAIQLYLQINEMQENGLLSVYKKNGSNGINNFDFDNFLSHDFVVTNNTSYITPIMTIMDKITNLRKELVLLIKSRDALLPRLMNGGEGLKLEGGAV